MIQFRVMHNTFLRNLSLMKNWIFMQHSSLSVYGVHINNVKNLFFIKMLACVLLASGGGRHDAKRRADGRRELPVTVIREKKQHHNS